MALSPNCCRRIHISPGRWRQAHTLTSNDEEEISLAPREPLAEVALTK